MSTFIVLYIYISEIAIVRQASVWSILYLVIKLWGWLCVSSVIFRWVSGCPEWWSQFHSSMEERKYWGLKIRAWGFSCYYSFPNKWIFFFFLPSRYCHSNKLIIGIICTDPHYYLRTSNDFFPGHTVGFKCLHE